MEEKACTLLLNDGAVYHGFSFGHYNDTSGEIGTLLNTIRIFPTLRKILY